MDLKEQIKEALGLNKSIKLEWQSKMDDGTILVSTADTLESGVDISVLVEDGTTILLPIGTYKTEDGVSFRVEEEGVVAEVMETETEEVVEEEMADEKEKEEEDEKENKDEEDEKDEMADVEDWEGMEKRIQNLEDAVAKLKEEKDGGDDEVEEMAEVEEPGTNPKSIKTTEVVEFSIEELKAENEKLKEELAKLPGDAPLNSKKFAAEGTEKVLTKRQRENMKSSDRFLYDIRNKS